MIASIAAGALPAASSKIRRFDAGITKIEKEDTRFGCGHHGGWITDFGGRVGVEALLSRG
jgi:hypothetical protein